MLLNNSKKIIAADAFINKNSLCLFNNLFNKENIKLIINNA